MSRASEEAHDRYPVGGDGGVSVESIIMDNDNGILQKAYIAGRTAESTEAEVRAAAIQQYFIELPLHGATATLEQAEYDFNATISSNERRTRMMNARSVLAAVRSVVMA